MIDTLTAKELVNLVKRVFSPTNQDKQLAIIVDMPDKIIQDNEKWKIRREMAANWVSLLKPFTSELGLDHIKLVLYRNAHANNADLPSTCYFHEQTSSALPQTVEEIKETELSFTKIFTEFQIIIAPTQFSATAPLKMAAKKFGFRAATMPGFSKAMIPALRLDYNVIGKKVDMFKQLLDDAVRCDILFDANGTKHNVVLDLRHRQGHASGGVFPNGFVAGNLPSGESYIVPYEGEIKGDPSQSEGEIPVQFNDDIVVYRIKNNVAIEIVSNNPMSKEEFLKLKAEPAYGNIAELGLGVLGDFGLDPTGEILLDEKLGLHIAFGRSEHFGGQVGPNNFSSPDKVVHIDRVYISQIQPKVTIAKATLLMKSGKEMLLMKNGKYSIEL